MKLNILCVRKRREYSRILICFFPSHTEKSSSSQFKLKEKEKDVSAPSSSAATGRYNVYRENTERHTFVLTQFQC